MAESKSEIRDQRSEILSAAALHKRYRMGSEDLHVLRGVEIRISRGEWVAILGASGSGKSTLLHLLGGLDHPSEGSVRFEGCEVFNQGDGAVNRYRNRHVGFVFQFYHLLPELTALENVVVSAMIGHSVLGWSGAKAGARARATELLTRLGLGERMKHRPGKLSGGERQRVAIARALVNQPELLLADEPTGNLDANTGGQILDVFREFHRAGQTIVMVTHDPNVAAAADRRVKLESGRLAV